MREINSRNIKRNIIDDDRRWRNIGFAFGESQYSGAQCFLYVQMPTAIANIFIRTLFEYFNALRSFVFFFLLRVLFYVCIHIFYYLLKFIEMMLFATHLFLPLILVSTIIIRASHYTLHTGYKVKILLS